MEGFFEFSEYFLEIPYFHKEAQDEDLLILRVRATKFTHQERDLGDDVTPEVVFNIKQ